MLPTLTADRCCEQGVSNSGTPQLGAGTQREGLVQITRVGGLLPPGIDIFVTGRTGQPYQNACNGDSGGPIFVRGGEGGLVVGGVTSRGGLFCPVNSEGARSGASPLRPASDRGGLCSDAAPLRTGIYTSAVQERNLASITTVTQGWLGEAAGIVPGRCPVSQCCYDMVCDYFHPTKH